MSKEIILVTGAAGSIGSALIKRLAKTKPKKLIILDQDETGIFDLYHEVKDICNVDYHLASICDEVAITGAFYEHKPTIVYHAAAYKHVSVMEKHPKEARKTNVFGLQNVVNSAIEFGVKKFVFISSDKAVLPKCVMGKTKAEGEKICLKNNGKTKFMCVRFGNVMPSRGSVVPIFNKLIAENKPLTVTSPKMKRYFLGIYDAVDLVIKAAELGKGGEIFVLDMGEPILIADLAKMMIKLSGKPLEIVYTHPSEGEKYDEILMTPEEKKRCKKVGNLFVIYANVSGKKKARQTKEN
jgi:FlaA1/EpsC-like NDP-sugar epimerase